MDINSINKKDESTLVSVARDIYQKGDDYSIPEFASKKVLRELITDVMYQVLSFKHKDLYGTWQNLNSKGKNQIIAKAMRWIK